MIKKTLFSKENEAYRPYITPPAWTWKYRRTARVLLVIGLVMIAVTGSLVLVKGVDALADWAAK